MKGTGIDAKGQRMLELLAEGASARVVARKMGYSEGTTRVYLHNLYRAIGVGNKTEAVIWYLNRARPAEARPAPSLPSVAPSLAGPDASTASFGEMALAEDLYTALGAMSGFIGPYGHVWEAGLRLKGASLDEKLVPRRAQSRLLWRALLKGDFGYGKMLHDDGAAERMVVDAPSDAVILAALLLLGGYTAAGERVASHLALKRKGAAGISAREASLLRALRDSVEGDGEAGLAALHELASESGRASPVKQEAMVALFHAYRARRDGERARATADCVWAEAESARQQLEAMGVRPLAREASLPRPARVSARESSTARERAAAGR
ncbi:MAG TPA: helix-turn-helix transcriptional regulator [Usitatibacter sp.]|nr:helix-turn-helix transcriptional regulator [Usitatibacter sp.]